MKQIFILLIYVAVVVTPTQGQSRLRILFVGNSLTYANDLPEMLKEIGLQEGVDITYKSFLFPDYSLEDHWNEGKIVQEINSQQYDFLIAQQGPSALPESQRLLLEYTRKFAGVCMKNKTRLALFMVWPSKTRAFDFENVIKSYSQAAGATGSLLCPAGKAWLKVLQMNSQMALYGPDNFHPGRTGSFLAAMTLYASLRNKTDLLFLNYGKLSIRGQVTKEQLDTLRQAVAFSLKGEL